jgi:hypothetical protein
VAATERKTCSDPSPLSPNYHVSHYERTGVADALAYCDALLYERTGVADALAYCDALLYERTGVADALAHRNALDAHFGRVDKHVLQGARDEQRRYVPCAPVS